MSVRVVARIRPLLKSEHDKDVVVTAASAGNETPSQPTVVRIPNPKNNGENFNFQFNSVYSSDATQQDIFDNEVSPTIKHLFNGFDVTLFAYGVTGTGKTYTMRGGKVLAERGVIPRLLSGIYRRSRKIEKDTKGETNIAVTMSYYEIYNDKVFDLFEPPEKRTTTGLQLRDNGGKTVVVALTERPCESLKMFEKLYDQANVNRSTSATKLNAHSSRSHAILCVKLSVTTGDRTRTSMASAIDLAGSEDNRRTDNGKDRLVESASINKSLFVLAQCVEAIGKKQTRIPYRESKMTRILSLGQNNGLTIMILNLAPVRSYHLDTLSSLNFANRTKKIEIKEIENEAFLKGDPHFVPTVSGSSISRQPLRPLTTAAHNAMINTANHSTKTNDKPPRAFSVYSDTLKSRRSNSSAQPQRSEAPKSSSPLKRPSDTFMSRPTKIPRSSPSHPSRPSRSQRAPNDFSQASIEDMVERKVSEILAARALDQPSIAPVLDISEEVQRRLESLEQKIEGKDDSRAEGLTFLLMAKQHYVRGELTSALKMYELATEYFPDNAKLDNKIAKLQARIEEKKGQVLPKTDEDDTPQISSRPSSGIVEARPEQKSGDNPEDDAEHQDDKRRSDSDYESSDGFRYRSKGKKGHQPMTKSRLLVSRSDSEAGGSQTPRTRHLLDIINTRDVSQIRLLKGIGAKKAGLIVEALCAGEEEEEEEKVIGDLGELGRLKGVGAKTVENMRLGLGSVALDP